MKHFRSIVVLGIILGLGGACSDGDSPSATRAATPSSTPSSTPGLRNPYPAVLPKPGWTAAKIDEARYPLRIFANRMPNIPRQYYNDYAECLLTWITDNLQPAEIGLAGIRPGLVSVSHTNTCTLMYGV